MTVTTPKIKGAAIPVSIRQVEAAHPHLTRLPIDSAPRVRLPGHEGRLYPILTAARHFVEPVMMSLKRLAAFV